jgi:predicted phosphoadenosine phosphosulfate sulfurtransferase
VPKRGLGIDVLTAARERIAWTFDTFPRVYLSFSGGKDSTVLLHLVMAEAARRGRKVGLLFIDMEAQYRLTIDHIATCYERYADLIEPHWVALPLALRNAVSQFEPKWLCWDPERRDDWVREPHPLSVTDEAAYPFFRRGMEFEEFVPDFGEWYAGGTLTACLVAIRADESLNRFRTLIKEKVRFEGRQWSTWVRGPVWNLYPIYDWRTEDIWTWHARTGEPYNDLYNLMHRAGMSIHQMRICQPYGDDQRKGLWLYHVAEPNTWARVVARVNGANMGAIYATQSGSILGRIRATLPPGHSWESYTRYLLASMPPKAREHYENKILLFLRWWMARGYPQGIPDVADAKAEASKEIPTWRRICRCLLKNDHWMKGLSFGQTKSQSYENYLRIMRNRRRKWGI